MLHQFKELKSQLSVILKTPRLTSTLFPTKLLWYHFHFYSLSSSHQESSSYTTQAAVLEPHRISPTYFMHKTEACLAILTHWEASTTRTITLHVYLTVLTTRFFKTKQKKTAHLHSCTCASTQMQTKKMP